MDSPEDLYESGIFINDLSMHDSSRDFILAGSQQNPELSLALSQVWLPWGTMLRWVAEGWLLSGAICVIFCGILMLTVILHCIVATMVNL